jgi:hypothetical protein
MALPTPPDPLDGAIQITRDLMRTAAFLSGYFGAALEGRTEIGPGNKLAQDPKLRPLVKLGLRLGANKLRSIRDAKDKVRTNREYLQSAMNHALREINSTMQKMADTSSFCVSALHELGVPRKDCEDILERKVYTPAELQNLLAENKKELVDGVMEQVERKGFTIVPDET